MVVYLVVVGWIVWFMMLVLYIADFIREDLKVIRKCRVGPLMMWYFTYYTAILTLFIFTGVLLVRATEVILNG